MVVSADLGGADHPALYSEGGGLYEAHHSVVDGGGSDDNGSANRLREGRIKSEGGLATCFKDFSPSMSSSLAKGTALLTVA